MPYTSFGKMLKDAQRDHFTVPAFNILNMETLQAAVSAAEEMRVPLIAQVYHEHLAFAGAAYIASLARTAAEKARIDICLSLDHGQSYEMAELCIKNGFSGVMIDLASSEYEKNVEQTRRVVSLAHENNVSVEAELGKIFDASSSLEERNSGMTDPYEAASFVRDTGIDALAVSVGTAHGFYSSAPCIDYERLEKLIEIVPCPIVVHGGSNTPDEDIKKMVKMGIAKLNIGTDLMAAFEEGMRMAMKGDEFVPLEKVLSSGRENEKRVCMEKLRLLTHCRVIK